MKNVLIPTDFSDNARHALNYAQHLFKAEACTFHILHCYTPAFYRMDYVMGGPEVSAIPDTGVDLSLAGLEQTLEDAKRDFPNPLHRFEMRSEFNTLTDAIQEVSQAVPLDLIVMGTRGASGAKQFFLGSNTVFAIRKAQVPLLAVPERARFHPLRTILFPHDYLYPVGREDLQPLLQLATAQDARVMLLHIDAPGGLTDSQKDHKAGLERGLGYLDYETVAVEAENIPQAILEFTETHPIDLLAMMNRKHTVLERLLQRQKVDQIGFHIQIPFLVIPDHSAQ
ncbi:universal stress protein [Robiginitalea sp. M366]|uniref:universal stress protein n=1 Tax=Robiginitalea aestuariiviva TaxID=3036903 RepID=UPI00240D6F5B|nr:universal stress protein [Robiginitalea aestuariiviva]MDG1572039.1 universal stress protein [Robiginitalea aestuariiviva]